MLRMWFLSLLGLLLCLMVQAQQAGGNSYYPMPQSSPSSTPASQYITHAEIAQIFNLPLPLPKFDPKRTVQYLQANCKTWQEPPVPDQQAKEWYRAATSIHAIKLRTVEQHQHMLQLYEAAARRGHYTAVKNLTILYSEGALVVGARFMPEPEKASYWLTQAIRQHRWLGALEWVPHIMGSNGSGLSGQEYRNAYLQAASDRGIALAQFQLALVYGNLYKVVEKEKALLACAAKQGLSAAQNEAAAYKRNNGFPQEALELFQQAVMNGNEAGGWAAYNLSRAFVEGHHNQKALHTPTDPIRKDAYYELNDALRDGRASNPRIIRNPFYRFPRLNEVLPLPPAVVTEWRGIYSAMSEDDATYYQNPPPAEFYLKQIEQAGLIVPLEYISQPYYPKPGESIY